MQMIRYDIDLARKHFQNWFAVLVKYFVQDKRRNAQKVQKYRGEHEQSILQEGWATKETVWWKLHVKTASLTERKFEFKDVFYV